MGKEKPFYPHVTAQISKKLLNCHRHREKDYLFKDIRGNSQTMADT
jgi:hypothetical protein